MRIVVALLLLVATVALWLATTSSDAPAPGVDGPAAQAPSPGAVPAAAPSLPPGTKATRANVERQPVAGLAEAPSCHIQVIDHGTRAPVANAAVRRVQTSDEIATTDERGCASLSLREPEQLAVVRDGFLLRLVPARIGTTAAEPQRVELVRDEWSPRVRLSFRAERALTGAAFVRFQPVDPANITPAKAAAPPSPDAFLQRAWSEHGMLAGRPVCSDVPIVLGFFTEQRVHRVAEGQEVRFVVPGAYHCDVATLDGFTGRARIDVPQRTGIEAPVAVVGLRRGAFVSGTVTDATTKAPLAAATVAIEGGDPLGLEATTTPAGAFRIGPLLEGATTLHVRHGDHEPRAIPVTAPAENVVVDLQPLPRTSLRGRVRSRPDLQPIAGATVAWTPVGSAAVTTTTAADGTFVLPATGQAPARLAIRAPSFILYAELVAPGAPFADYDLLPAAPEVRLRKKLTAVFAGVVVDAAGALQPGIAVRWHPSNRAATEGSPARRVLDGGTLQLPLVVTTAADGSFRIETDAFGPGKLLCRVGGAVDGDRGIDVEAVPGIEQPDLRLVR